MKSARGSVSDSVDVQVARSLTADHDEVLELVFRSDNCGYIVVLPLDAVPGLTADLIMKTEEARRERAKREVAGP